MEYGALIIGLVIAVVLLFRFNRNLEAATQIAMLLNRGYSFDQAAAALKIKPEVVAYYQSRSSMFKEMVQQRARSRSLPR